MFTGNSCQKNHHSLAIWTSLMQTSRLYRPTKVGLGMGMGWGSNVHVHVHTLLTSHGPRFFKSQGRDGRWGFLSVRCASSFFFPPLFSCWWSESPRSEFFLLRCLHWQNVAAKFSQLTTFYNTQITFLLKRNSNFLIIVGRWKKLQVVYVSYPLTVSLIII